MNKKEGLAKTYYENGNTKTETQYKNDKIDAPVKTFYKSGKIKSEIEYYDSGKIKTEDCYDEISDELNTKSYYENGYLRHEVSIKNDRKEGESKSYNIKANLVAKIIYKNNRVVENSEFYYDNGNIKFKIINNENSNPNDNSAEIYDKGGNLIGKGRFKNNSLLCYDNEKGEYCEERYQDGILTLITEYYPKSNYQSCNKTHATLEGKNNHWKRNNNINKEKIYVNGLLDTVKEYYKNESSSLKRKEKYKDGVLEDAEAYGIPNIDVEIAEKFLISYLKDPYSYEKIDYYNHSDGSVTIKYRAKNSFGGYVVHSQTIYP